MCAAASKLQTENFFWNCLYRAGQSLPVDLELIIHMHGFAHKEYMPGFSFVHTWVAISLPSLFLPSMLRHCWLGITKSIWPVKIEWWVVAVVVCLERGADCLHMVQLMSLPSKTPSSLASFKSRLVLPFWCRLTQVVLKKRPLNRCSSSSSEW